MLEMAVQVWRDPGSNGSSLWDRIAALKGHIAVESGGSDGANSLATHEEAVRRDGSAVLFCIYRGRSSEGVSLADHAVRGVVCVGIPLPPLSPFVRLKRDYHDAVARATTMAHPKLNGENWYNLDAHRAVNQALGRVIRHRRDYGVAVLLDARWTTKGSLRAVKYLPKWLRQLHRLRDEVRGEALSCPVHRLIADLRRTFDRHSDRATAAPQERIEETTQSDFSDEHPSRNVRPRLVS